MPLPDVSELTIDELEQLKKLCDKTITKKRREEKAALKRQIDELVRAKGFKLDEIIGGSAQESIKKPPQNLTAKYRHPSDESKTWHGKGPRPDWIKAHLDAGGTLEELEI